MKYLLDTHTWIWWNMSPEKLSTRVKRIILNIEKYNEILLSAISPWEFSKLIEKGRLKILINPLEWIEKAMELPKFRLVHLTPEIAFKSTILPGSFHNDPADQIIVATARNEDAILLTTDQRLLNYKHVKSKW